MNMRELAQYRIRCGVKMVDLAKMMGKSKMYVNNLEKGNCKNATCSNDEKQNYLNSLYRCMSNFPFPKKAQEK